MPERLEIAGIPALVWGESAKRVYLYIHGKMGRKEEAESFAALACPAGWQVLSLDLPGHGERTAEPLAPAPWRAVPELRAVYAFARARWGQIALRANSIGAWLALLAYAEAPLARCLFVSPVLDMERLIGRMMEWAGVLPEQLERAGEIPTAFGETLSWEYYGYARARPIRRWEWPTAILYPDGDNLTERATAEDFAGRFRCALTVAQDTEHWFHTEEQLAVLARWTRERLQEG